MKHLADECNQSARYHSFDKLNSCFLPRFCPLKSRSRFREVVHQYVARPYCWNSALCYQVFLVLLVDDLKRFSVLASLDTSFFFSM